MAQVLALPPFEASPRSETFTERWGGFLVSLFFHLMIFVTLLTIVYERPPEPTINNSVQLSISPSLSGMAPAAALPTPPPESALTEVARTSPFGDITDQEARDNTPSEEIGEPQEGPTDAIDPETTSTVMSSRMPADDSEEPAPLQISEALRQRIAEQTQLAAADIERQHIARTQLRGRLWNEMDQNRTRNADFISDGGLQGTIREMDFTGVPLEAVRATLRRYGAEMEERELRPEDTNQGPIPVNAARIGDQVLTAQRGPMSGRALLITFGHELTARLEELEVNALARAGININDVAVTRIVFGLDPVMSGYDFRVRDIQWVRVEDE